ncbi:hypothetical protein BLOT_015342 [Blomia tropicalis]|nr:hypothetical protein BLOT_015342 [Blomia tropicalis]
MSRNSTSLILEQCLTIVHSSVGGGGGGGGGISVPNCFASMESGETDPQSKWKWIRSNADRHDSLYFRVELFSLFLQINKKCSIKIDGTTVFGRPAQK